MHINQNSLIATQCKTAVGIAKVLEKIVVCFKDQELFTHEGQSLAEEWA